MAIMWIDERVEYLKSASKISDAQKLLIALYDEQANLTAVQKKKYELLVTAEKAAAKNERAIAALRAIETNEKEISRKERNHQLFKAAGLLSLAGLIDKESGKPNDAGALLGGLLSIAEQLKDPAKAEQYRKTGDTILKQINDENEAKAAAKTKARAERAERVAASTAE